MRPGTTRFLLALSAAFNLAFVIGWLFVRSPARALRADPPSTAVRELELTADQEALFHQFRLESAEREKAALEGSRETIATIWRELGAETPNRDRIRTALKELSESVQALNEGVVDQMIAFNETLSDPQRARFLRMARERHVLKYPTAQD